MGTRIKPLNKLVIVISIMIVLITMILCLDVNTVAFADISLSFDSTDILDDLQGMTIDGKPFNVNDYPTNSVGDIQAITFVEYCYSQYANALGNYALYIYIYNPSLKRLDNTHVLNKLQLAIEFNNKGVPSKYKKFSLRYCSSTANGLFYKYKLVDRDNEILNAIRNYAQNNLGKRCYYVSGIELVNRGNTTAEEYKIGKQYTYEGYADGYGDSTNFPLTMTAFGLDTLSTEVHYAFYRPSGTTGAYNYTQNQLNSVYFSVPNSLIKKYGVLTAVHMEWYEYLTKEIFAFRNDEAIKKLQDYLGRKINQYDDNVKYGLAVWLNENSSSEGGNIASQIYNNPRPNNIYCQNVIDTIYYLFDLDNATNSVISSETMLNYIKNYNGSGNKINGKYYEELFASNVSSGRTRGYNEVNVQADDKLSLLNYTFESKWWQLGWGSYVDNSFGDIEGIKEIKASDMMGSKSTICNKLFLDESCYDDFKSVYDTSIVEDKTVFLLRFGVTEYTSMPLAVLEKSTLTYKKVDTSGYCAQQTVFLDLDIIDVTFRSEDTVTVIPVVSSPIDAMANITPPIEPENNNWLKIFIAVVALILLCVIFAPVLPYVIQFVIRIIALPFKLVGAVFKSINKAVKRK